MRALAVAVAVAVVLAGCGLHEVVPQLRAGVTAQGTTLGVPGGQRRAGDVGGHRRLLWMLAMILVAAAVT